MPGYANKRHKPIRGHIGKVKLGKAPAEHLTNPLEQMEKQAVDLAAIPEQYFRPVYGNHVVRHRLDPDERKYRRDDNKLMKKIHSKVRKRKKHGRR